MNTHPRASIERSGRLVAVTGVVLPLLLIGGLKFTPIEVEALKPLIGGARWRAWVYAAFGEVGTSRLLGSVEITTAVLFLVSPWAPRAGVVGAPGLRHTGELRRLRPTRPRRM